MFVSPYEGHRRLIQNVLNKQEVEVMTLKVGQGGGKDLLIYSGWKNPTNVGQLGLTSQSTICDPRNVYVEMREAKRNLVVILDTKILSNRSEYWVFQFMTLKA